MAITKPTLDQLTGSIDAFVGSLDSDADLLRADFTKEPTLEELDTIVGTLESVDTFGNLDNLSFDFFSAVGSGSIAVAASGVPVFDEFAAGSASIAITQSTLAGVVGEVLGSAAVSMAATAGMRSLIPFDASVSLSGALTASCTITVSMAGTATLAVTSTCTPDPDLSKQPTLEELDALVGTMENADQFGNMDTGLIFTFREMPAAASMSMSATAVRSPIVTFSASVTGAASVAALAAFIARFDGSASVAMTTTSVYERIGTMSTHGTGEYTVAVVNDGGQNKFKLNDEIAPSIALTRGLRYVFDVSDASNAGHPLGFRTNDDILYTASVTRVGTEGTSGATVTVVMPILDLGVNSVAKYHCIVHGNAMGNSVTVEQNAFLSEVTVSAEVQAVLLNTASADFAVSANSDMSRVFDVSGNAQLEMSINGIGKIPGEDWTVVDKGSETWSVETAGTEVWATQTGNSRTWLEQ